MQKITPFLWFDGNAEEAMNYYTTVFKDSKVKNVSRMGGQVLTVEFELNGQDFIGLNGGPMFKFTEAVSFFVNCNDQAEVDYYWNKLLEGGKPSRCSWLQDKFGLWWQIVPKRLMELMGDKDREKANRVMQAMLKMDKIIIADLEAAAAG
jgi:predicted 3-demethylubiquinone-9 3-methyltransferase (glyoxalase superfamily)